MGVNRQYKSSVFSLLFSDPPILRELYGALTGVNLPEDVPIVINTLTDALFMERINDISFLIAEQLIILLEHQSTINPNMALRMFLYLSRIYEKMLEPDTLYSGKRLTIPRPELIVLYNGTAPYPDESTLKMSDAFRDGAFPRLVKEEDGEPVLEVRVKVYNINEGRNEGLLRRSETLGGYSRFIAKARACEMEIAAREKRAKLSEEERKEAMAEAVRWCISQGILKDFLELHGSEVVNMLIAEWNWDTFIAVREREAREVGWKKGRQEGEKQGWKKGRQEGRAEGREEGEKKGREKAFRDMCEVARKMKGRGLSSGEIAELTSLSVELIETL
jgi:predicted transposase YdaD